MQEFGLPFVFGMFMIVPAAAKVIAEGFVWALSLITFRRRGAEGKEVRVTKA